MQRRVVYKNDGTIIGMYYLETKLDLNGLNELIIDDEELKNITSQAGPYQNIKVINGLVTIVEEYIGG